MKSNKTKLLYAKRLFVFVKEVGGDNIIIKNLENGTHSIVSKHDVRALPDV